LTKETKLIDHSPLAKAVEHRHLCGGFVKYRFEYTTSGSDQVFPMAVTFEAANDAEAIAAYDRSAGQMREARESGIFSWVDSPVSLRRIEQEEITTLLRPG
jgi:hypothetical protein